MDCVSVIVRIYNMEKRLSRCLSCLKNQTYSNLEILLIDDGSTDASADICNHFCNEDSRFHYYYKENGGRASAFNWGFKKATGKWFTVCDSDDWLGDTYISDLVTSITQRDADIAIGGYKIIDADGTVYDTKAVNFTGTLSKKEMLQKFWELLSNSLINSSCNKLYKRGIIKTLIDESMTCGEDLRFNMLSFCNAEAFSFSASNEYYYFVPKNQVIKYPKNDARQCELYSSSVRQFLENSHAETVYIEEYRRFLCGNICRDVGVLAKSKPYKEAVFMISQFYDYPDFVDVINRNTWKCLNRNYQIVGWLLKHKLIPVIIICAKMR